MCTVTYVPSSAGFTLTQNRDEKPDRAPQSIISGQLGEYNVRFPQDQRAYGTWIFTRNDGLSACLLNGAFTDHSKLPRYRLSRGMIMLDLAAHDDFESWSNHIDLTLIEPFTVIVRSGNLYEFRWDGMKKHKIILDATVPYIWSSSTLYTDHEKNRRKRLFNTFLAQHDFHPSAVHILDFHQLGDLGDKRINLVMERNNGIRTQSITQIISEHHRNKISYTNLII